MTLSDYKQAIKCIKAVVDEQANSEGLWCVLDPPDIFVSELQHELRRLHRAIEENIQGGEA
jgi:hypothetical protein